MCIRDSGQPDQATQQPVAESVVMHRVVARNLGIGGQHLGVARVRPIHEDVHGGLRGDRQVDRTQQVDPPRVVLAGQPRKLACLLYTSRCV